ncbi:MAG: triose-phosphate isomerase [Gammaproteobacteria bacterium]|nr:triose-phosphate isomerase [Gammaproteobacteria bacterium]
MRQAFVAGNWKMNGSRASARALIDGLKQDIDSVTTAEVVVCPSFVYLADVQSMLSDTRIALGAQNLSEQKPGAFTGEIAGEMLKDFDCKYVIIGHSERRAIYGETDALIASKFTAALEQGLSPIFCLGELLEERQQNQTESVIARQLDAILALPGGLEGLRSAVIAYEPVWAIGTGMTATPEQAQTVHAFIRQRIAEKDAEVAAGVQILYGGSVKPDNAVELFSQADIDGGLIGGAALDAESFLTICRAAGA